MNDLTPRGIKITIFRPQIQQNQSNVYEASGTDRASNRPVMAGPNQENLDGNRCRIGYSKGGWELCFKVVVFHFRPCVFSELNCCKTFFLQKAITTKII